MFKKTRAKLNKNSPQPLQLSEEDEKKELDKQLLELIDSRRFTHDPIPEIKVKVQSLLAKGANINARGYKQTTPLHDVVINDQLELVKFFISQGSEVDAKNDFNQTPLYRVKSKAVTEELLKAGADIDVIDNDRRTPLESSLCRQGYLLSMKKCSPKSIYSESQPYHDANETLAKAYLTKYPNLEYPNYSEKIISKKDWEVWREQCLKKCFAFSEPLESLPSTSKAAQTDKSIKEGMDLLEKQTQCLQIQKEGDEKDGGRLQNSLFFTQYKTPQENKQTKLEKELRVTS